MTGGTLRYTEKEFHSLLPSWLNVTCRVQNAEEIMEAENSEEIVNAENSEGIVNAENLIGGEPYPTDHLMVKINNIMLEIYSKHQLTLGRSTFTADVSVEIPSGCMDDEKREELCCCIGRKQSQLEYLGETIQIKKVLGAKNITYVDEKDVPVKGIKFKNNVKIGFSSDVSWEAKVQKTVQPNVEGEVKGHISALVLYYPSCEELYKLFVWPCCNLKDVDERLPKWRIAYKGIKQSPLPQGAFYVITENNECFFLNPLQPYNVDNIQIILYIDEHIQ